MHAHLAKIDRPSEDRRRDCSAGDEAAAIGIAVGMRTADTSRPDFDDAKTALAVCAVRGSDAAHAVMSKVLRWLPEANEAAECVALSWLALPASVCACRSSREPQA